MAVPLSPEPPMRHAILIAREFVLPIALLLGVILFAASLVR